MSLPTLAHLPYPAEKRLAVRVTNSAETIIRQGHPWVFDQSIQSISHEGDAGDLAIIFDKKRKFLGIGLYDPDSPIRIKMVHRGKAATINTQFWRAALEKALQQRQDLATTRTNGYRCINGENDKLPGLILDRYADTLVLKLYTAAWLPHLHAIVPQILDLLQPTSLILRMSRRLQNNPLSAELHDGMALYGTAPAEPVLFNENDLVFESDVVDGQKTGFFLDQRDNRDRVRQLASGKTVLDVFSCTGGFAVYAAAGGATAVTSVDLSRPALDSAERNMLHNIQHPAIAACNFNTIATDAFGYLEAAAKQKMRFDIVILDPPAFAQKQKDVDGALHAYKKLARLGLGVLAKDGVLVAASCSSRVSADLFKETIEDAIQRFGRTYNEIAFTTHAADHPITFKEGAYLKCFFGRIN